MQKLNFLIFSSFFSLFFLYSIFLENGVLNNIFYIDNFIKLIITLTISFFIFIILINLKNPKRKTFFFFIIILYFILILFFTNENLFFFYVFFEISIIPILFLVSTWGYSMERIKAIIYIYIYTVFFSLPFLIYLIYYDVTTKSFSIIYRNFNRDFMEEVIIFFFPFLFLVKIPVWGFHFWLPKAHVEASTEGSIILAGIILKLRGLGLLKISYIWNITNINNIPIYFYFSFRRLGAIIISIYALRITDSKIIVALSSIIHISIIFLVFLFSSSLSVEVMYLIIVSHGFVSPLIFFFLRKIYEKILSRRIRFRRGILKNFNFLKIFWFILCVLNIGVPLSINFLREIEFFFIRINFCIIVSFIIISITFTRGLLNIFLFNFFASGKKKFFFYLKEYKNNLIFLVIFIIYVSLFLFFMEEY